MDVRVYWLWLQRALGPGNLRARRLLTRFSDIRALYEASRGELQEAGIAGAELKRLCDKETAADRLLLDSLLTAGAWLLTPDDAYYPTVLFGIPDPPLVLYGLGEMPDLEHMAVMGMVGTRKSSEEGANTARGLAFSFARHGMIVVSGGAVGIDAASHEGALRAGGRTIAIQACGLDIDYPHDNSGLRRQILASGGALLTEYPLGTPPNKYRFPVRNRLISGLSAGVCVVEAPARSGALITARLALEQGRDVFAVPGGIHDINSEGANSLIKQGARLITSADEVLEEYRQRFPDIMIKEPPVRQAVFDREDAPAGRVAAEIKKAASPVPCPADATAEERMVYRALLGNETALSLDDLAARTGLPAARLLACLTLLEMKGSARALPGRQYALVCN